MRILLATVVTGMLTATPVIAQPPISSAVVPAAHEATLPSSDLLILATQRVVKRTAVVVRPPATVRRVTTRRTVVRPSGVVRKTTVVRRPATGVVRKKVVIRR